MNAVHTPVREVDLTERTGRRGTTGWWLLTLAAGLLGIVGTIWQMVERLAYESDPGREAFCEINAAVSCSSVYSHWQSSALGLPNALIGLPVFAMLTSAAVAGLLGSRHSPRYLALMWGLALFMTAFATWYMEQTAFVIGSLCVFCAASWLFIIVAGVSLTRVLEAERGLGAGAAGRRLSYLVDRDLDVVAWLVLVLSVTAMLVLKLPW